MNKLLTLLGVMVAVAGCMSPEQRAARMKQLHPETASEITVVPPIAQPPIAAATQPAVQPAGQAAAATKPTAKPERPPVAGRVVEIITKPTLATRPTTAAALAVNAARGTGDASVAANVPTPKLTLDAFNRVDTSVSCGPLVRLLAMKLNGIPYTGFAGYGALDFTPNLPEGTDPDKMTNDVLSRDASGTAGAIKRLIGGEVDLVLAPRVPDDDEAAAAKSKKITLRSDLIATEALVFTVNSANPVTAVSRQQLQQIFTGAATSWKDLGEPTVPLTSPIASEPITVAYRARGTGSEELLRQLVLQGKQMPELPVSRALSSSKLVLDASVEDPQTIGFSVFAYASNMKRDGRVKVLAVDGVVPEPNRVATGEYPLTTPIYVITRADLASDTGLYQLRTWLASMNGQKVLAEAGYMPVSSEAWTAVRLMGK